MQDIRTQFRFNLRSSVALNLRVEFNKSLMAD